MSAVVDQLKALYRPDAGVSHSGLVNVADALQSQLIGLAEDPTVERCEAVAANLDGARRAVLRVQESLAAAQEVPHEGYL